MKITFNKLIHALQVIENCQRHEDNDEGLTKALDRVHAHIAIEAIALAHDLRLPSKQDGVKR